MNTHHVESFLLVAQSGSFSQAAVASGLSQPLMTRHVQALEAALKTRLLHRDGHGVSLTAAGRRMLPSLRAVRAAALRATQEGLAASGQVLRRAAIAMPPTLIRVLAAPLTQAILAEAPEAELQLVDAFSGTLAEWLAEGRVDLAILYESGISARVQAEPLLTEHLHLVTRHDAADERADEPVRFAALTQERLILPSRAHGLRRAVEAAAAQAGLSLHVRIEADSFAAILGLVGAGLGSTILPRAAIGAELTRQTLRARPIVDPQVSRALSLATARNQALLPGTSRLMAITRGLIRRLDQENGWSTA